MLCTKRANATIMPINFMSPLRRHADFCITLPMGMRVIMLVLRDYKNDQELMKAFRLQQSQSIYGTLPLWLQIITLALSI